MYSFERKVFIILLLYYVDLSKGCDLYKCGTQRRTAENSFNKDKYIFCRSLQSYLVCLRKLSATCIHDNHVKQVLSRYSLTCHKNPWEEPIDVQVSYFENNKIKKAQRTDDLYDDLGEKMAAKRNKNTKKDDQFDDFGEKMKARANKHTTKDDQFDDMREKSRKRKNSKRNKPDDIYDDIGEKMKKGKERKIDDKFDDFGETRRNKIRQKAFKGGKKDDLYDDFDEQNRRERDDIGDDVFDDKGDSRIGNRQTYRSRFNAGVRDRRNRQFSSRFGKFSLNDYIDRGNDDEDEDFTSENDEIEYDESYVNNHIRGHFESAEVNDFDSYSSEIADNSRDSSDESDRKIVRMHSSNKSINAAHYKPAFPIRNFGADLDDYFDDIYDFDNELPDLEDIMKSRYLHGNYMNMMSNGVNYPNRMSNGHSYLNRMANGGNYPNRMSNGGNYQNRMSNRGNYPNRMSNRQSYLNRMSNGGNYLNRIFNGPVNPFFFDNDDLYDDDLMEFDDLDDGFYSNGFENDAFDDINENLLKYKKFGKQRHLIRTDSDSSSEEFGMVNNRFRTNKAVFDEYDSNENRLIFGQRGIKSKLSDVDDYFDDVKDDIYDDDFHGEGTKPHHYYSSESSSDSNEQIIPNFNFLTKSSSKRNTKTKPKPSKNSTSSNSKRQILSQYNNFPEGLKFPPNDVPLSKKLGINLDSQPKRRSLQMSEGFTPDVKKERLPRKESLPKPTNHKSGEPPLFTHSHFRTERLKAGLDSGSFILRPYNFVILISVILVIL
ncbi:uncharacterized protein LOC143072140 [Mytilus galloprovincialis]|uniref:uncharacterized protein LOC143072140 n=1 Tax=Mytilus galloprovincialis TaxID=29158 RepID=UPI003F7C574D